ncbi:hypothetical protein PUMCH_000203 [Australozyma saopauloensis]|uniref:EF-hand domain-containing protein n=1 Tax=Australozyma saopauloensis TaxID=291208 RepID=A0AAX4H4W1_9ASCO|nr:hypothetical protein PUMCH_000203 [[Candida] saopauloensis]
MLGQNFVFLLLITAAFAHKAYPVKPLHLTWQEWHMSEEHQIDTFDPLSFFMLHDIQGKGHWTAEDILYIYGLSLDSVIGDGSGMGEHDHEEKISPDFKKKVIEEVSVMLKADSDGTISKDKWLEFANNGGLLPDFGAGPGHHFDFETEYENHHWNKYHRDSDPDVRIKHKEDIVHELLHHQHEIEETHADHPEVREKLQNYLSPIKLDNVPSRYLF